MKISAIRQLDVYTVEVAAIADDVVVLMLRDGESFLECYDSKLAPRWSRRLGTRAVTLLSANSSTLWILDSEGVWTCDSEGESLARVHVQPRMGMAIGAFIPVTDGFVLAWQHDERKPMLAPVLDRVDLNGKVCWTKTLPVGPVEYKGVVQMSANEGWKPRPMDPWMPESWFTTSRTLTVSGDAVLVCYSEMPRSGIGMGYVSSLADGMLRFTTKLGPISQVAALGGGAFLVGYQGYGAFKTRRYERDGHVSDRWKSHGHYLVGDSIRVIELENTLPSKMHLVRLSQGGHVTKGDRLDGYYTSRPFMGADGTAYFFRKGSLLAARDLRIDETLELAAPDDMLFSNAIVGNERGMYLAFTLASERGRACLVRIDW